MSSTPGLFGALPTLGTAGSRSSHALHSETYGPTPPLVKKLGTHDIRRFMLCRWLGTTGSIIIMIGGWGAGALPVVNNTLWDFAPAALMGRMLLAATSLVFVGIGCLVTAWLAMGYFALAAQKTDAYGWASTPVMIRTFILWVTPLILTAPLFTQDIYSYIAQGTIAARGMDPYSAGPVDLLGITDPLSRSVPLIWSHSPSPYGPVAILVGEAISALTGTSIISAVFAYRIIAIAGLGLCAWALTNLARRLGVEPSASLWLGVLNPLSILHLIGGIHNESLMLGLVLAGMECCLRAFDRSDGHATRTRAQLWHSAYFLAGVVAISLATMVKITAVVALAFIWVAMIRRWDTRRAAWLTSGLLILGVAVGTIVGVSWVSGLGMGWLFVQGGAAEIISWMSLPTLLGLIASNLGAFLGLGDQLASILPITRGLGLLVAAAWMLRMMWATYKGQMHALGGYGVGMLVMVVLFPVVHPWYMLWAILPLSAWANRPAFRNTVVIYSTLLSFFLLPRGMRLPPWNVVQTYCVAIVGFALTLALLWAGMKIWEARHPSSGLRR